MSSWAARRALTRWAVRVFRRQWRQQLLVLTLLTVTVAAAVAGSGLAVNLASDDTGRFGAATALLRIDARDPATARAALDDAGAGFATIEAIAHARVPVPGAVAPLDVRDQDPAGPYGAPMLALRAGRYPTTAGELALTESAAGLLGAGLGHDLPIDGAARTVVGIVENPRDLDDDFALVAPGTLAHTDAYVVLVDRATAAPGDGDRLRLELPSTDRPEVRAAVAAAVAMALALAGLVAAAGFSVLAQRRRRQVGLLAAIGATGRQVELVLAANGAIVGVTAACGGLACGVVAWALARPVLESVAGRRIDWADLPWGLVLAIGSLAVVAATAAAWWPARATAHAPITAMLSSRPSPPRDVRRSRLAAAALLVAGVAAIAVARPTTEGARPMVLVAGLLAVVAGTVMATPTAIRAVGAVAGHAPIGPRIALRDLARYQARAAAALAATTLALTVAVGIVLIAAADDADDAPANLADDQLLLAADRPPGELTTLDDAAAAVASALGDGTRMVALDVAVEPGTGEAAEIARKLDDGIGESLGPARIATAELLAFYGIDPAGIDGTTDVLTSSDDAVVLIGAGADPDPLGDASPSQHVALPVERSAPSSLVTAGALARHGWADAREGWLVEATRPLTDEQLHAARQVAADHGLTIEVRTGPGRLGSLRTVTTAAGTALALAIAALTVTLMRNETVRELRTLTATGASSRTRRSITASTAAGLVVPAAVLGAAGAYVAVLASYRSHLDRLAAPPVAELLLLVVGLPVLTYVGSWLLAGREPRRLAE